MAAFLNAVHALPIGPARDLGMDEMDPTDFWDYMENNPGAFPWVRRTLWPIVTAAERTWIEQLFEGFIAQVRRTLMPLTICHNDMFPYYIIVNTTTQRVSGVIDFSWRITDPAGDFKAFEYYSPAFLDEVYAHYHHPVDPEFDSRRLFSTGHDEVFALVRALASRDATRITRHRASLSAYIRAHPRTGD